MAVSTIITCDACNAAADSMTVQREGQEWVEVLVHNVDRISLKGDQELQGWNLCPRCAPRLFAIVDAAFPGLVTR